MNVVVQPVPDSALLVDCYSPLTPAALQRLSAAVYQGRPILGCVRYHDNLSKAEVENILGVGWGLFTVGVARNDSMQAPDAGKGARDGLHAVSDLRSFGILPGVTCAVDVEGTTSASGDAVVAYVNAWDAVVSRETETIIYEGFGIHLSASDLYHRLAPRLYWASSPNSLPPAVRGFTCVQLVENITLAGVQVDIDRCQTDHLGSNVHWMIDAPSA